MKNNRNLILLVVIYVFVLILIGIYQPHEIDWNPTFAQSDQIPYGTFILRHRLGDLFPSSKSKTITESIYKTLHQKHFTNTNYMLIERHLSISNNDMEELLRFAKEGNRVFISSEELPYQLMDTLGIYQKFTSPFFSIYQNADTADPMTLSMISSAFVKDSVFTFENNMIPRHLSPKDSSYYFEQMDNGFEDSIVNDTNTLASKAYVISTVYHQDPIYIKIPLGQGFIYLHTYPYAFTNYYLLKDSTRRYAEDCLSYLPDADILWDEHYKSEAEHQRTSTLGFILQNDSLRWAYYSGFIFLILFVLFDIKRRQRIIPVVAPFRNTTLEFTETVGRLYFNRADHKNIADKKILFFLEHLRSHYYIDTGIAEADFVDKVTAKSGIERERIQYMTELIRALMQKRTIADTELIQLYDLIEYFKKNST